MKILFSNRFVSALAKTLVIFGFIHLAILFYLAGHGSVYALNAFFILNLDLVKPGLGDGMVNFVLSWCVVLAVYCLAFLYLTKPATKDKS